MTTIHRISLSNQKLKIQEGAVLLKVGGTGETLSAWFLVDTEAKMETRHIMAFPTGAPLPPNVWDTRHIDTIATSKGAIHVFEFTAAQMAAMKQGGAQ